MRYRFALGQAGEATPVNCNYFNEMEFTPWLTTGVVLIPTALTRQDENLEKNED